MRDAIAAELKTDLSPEQAPNLNDVKTTVALINANAVIGLPPKGDKVGASCALCHADTDGSVLNVPNGGSIGKRRDDPQGIIEKAADAMGLVTQRVEGDLRRFKAYIEARVQETSGWRGPLSDSHKRGVCQTRRGQSGRE